MLIVLLLQCVYAIDFKGVVKNQTNHQIFELQNDQIELVLEIKRETQTQLDISIYDKEQKNFRMPNTPPFDYNDIENPETYDTYEYQVILIENPFKVQVKRKEEIIFTISDIHFNENYIEFTHFVPTDTIFGLGERNQMGFRFKQGKYTLMARDFPKMLEDGKPPGKHVYSSQPVLLQREKSGKFDLFFYKTTSPMDVEYIDNSMKFIAIGGIIHIKLFLGDEYPINSITQYHNYLKGWNIPPFWSLGFHQSRWGYKSSQQLIQVIEKYQSLKIPIDIIWTDLDYMEDRQIFSVNSNKFTKSDFKKIKSLGVRYVPLLDVAVGVKHQDTDIGYQTGAEMDIFLYSPDTGHRFKGYVWPGDSYFPDFLHPLAGEFWTKMHHHLYEQVQFDGIWIDMNEPANFCDGECKKWSTRLNDDPVREEYKHPQLNLPYIPGGNKFENKTLPPHLVHYGGYLHKDIHNVYGHLDSYHTYNAQKDLGKIQPFLLTRSTFPGSGRYSSHWFGDNAATWKFLYLSLAQVFHFQIYGIPQTGADVCGFMQDTQVKLCCRWIQLGVLYPFFRNHNDDLSKPQEFYVLGDEVQTTALKNIRLRYSLLKWMYMLYKRKNGKGTIVNPLFFIFPNDPQNYREDVLDTQLILGEELMGSPILVEGFVRKAYFPQSKWYDLQTGLSMEGNQDHFIFSPYDDYVPLFVREGFIIVQQTQQEIMNIKSLNQNYRLIAAIDQNNKARGNFLDLNDFENEEQAINAGLLNISIEIQDSGINLKIELENGNVPESTIVVDQIVLYGFNSTQLNNTKLQQGFYQYNSVINGPFTLGDKKEKQIMIN